MLFEFGSDVDAEKVLQGEPWTFDCHLVIFQRFDGRRTIKELEFKFCAFWIQIHELPFRFMTPEIAMLIGETIGPIIPTNDHGEMEGGTFMRVTVLVDVSQPLCRGRKIVFDEVTEG